MQEKKEELFEVTEKHMIFQTKNFYIRLRIKKGINSWKFSYDIYWWGVDNFNMRFQEKFELNSMEDAYNDAFTSLNDNFKLITSEEKWKSF